jgi:hypothetical protein
MFKLKGINLFQQYRAMLAFTFMQSEQDLNWWLTITCHLDVPKIEEKMGGKQ